MKKIISLILALGLLLAPALLYAAAATVSSANRISLGNFAAVSGIASPNSGDTIQTGLRNVILFIVERNPSTAPNASSATDAVVEWTASEAQPNSGRVTVYTTTNGLRMRFFAVGTP